MHGTDNESSKNSEVSFTLIHGELRFAVGLKDEEGLTEFDSTHLEHSDSQPPPSHSFRSPRPHPTGLISADSKACLCGYGWQPLQ